MYSRKPRYWSPYSRYDRYRYYDYYHPYSNQYYNSQYSNIDQQMINYGYMSNVNQYAYQNQIYDSRYRYR